MSPSSSSQRTARLRYGTLLLLLSLLALSPAPTSAQFLNSNKVASQDLFPPQPSAGGDAAKGGGGYLAEITEKEKQAALDRFLFGQPHGHAKVSNNDSPLVKDAAAAVAAAVGKEGGNSKSAAADKSESTQRTSQDRKRRSSSRRRRRARDDDYDDEIEDETEEDRCAAPEEPPVERSPIGKFFYSLSWTSKLLWAYTYMTSLRTYLVLRFIFLPPLRLIYNAGHFTFTSLYSGLRSATLHSLRPFRLLVIAPIAYLLLGIYHVFLEVPLGLFKIAAKEFYPLYLFLGAATTIGMSLGLGAGIVLLAGSFVFKEGSEFENKVEEEGKRVGKSSGLEKTENVRERGRKHGSGASKTGTAGTEKPRRKSVIGKAMKEIKRNSRDYVQEEDDDNLDEEVYDLDDDAGAFGVWSGDKDKRSRRPQEKGKGRQAYDEEDFAVGSRPRYGVGDGEDSD